MNYQLIALDVDGTLLDDHHRLSPRNKQTIKRVYDAGASIVLCTGRSPQNTLPLMEELGIDGPAITHNGAVTVRSSDRSVLHEQSFILEQLAPYLTHCRSQEDLQLDCCTAFQLYVERLPANAAAIYEKFGLKPLLVPDVTSYAPFVKMSIFGGQPAIDRLQRFWEQKPGSLRTIRSGDFFIDVMHPLSTKGNALKRLAAKLGVQQERVLAIGNYFNDQEMIEFAGMGIAVANSPEQLKQAADRVTLSNNEDGVHAALLEHCFGERGGNL